ncbi:unnamed protein product [Gongylonema pulchrum]|uniref:Uncharacterized protein n=1 Tax=Gongylonema pulchrum TaxID=637853 RepID=A0A183CVK0_9BILA|nr:unnamed protein product [Gongylonema pulchrum]
MLERTNVQAPVQLEPEVGAVADDDHWLAELKNEDRELENADKLELATEPDTNASSTEQNMTEVYEEPFIRVYFRPLCNERNC